MTKLENLYNQKKVITGSEVVAGNTKPVLTLAMAVVTTLVVAAEIAAPVVTFTVANVGR